jgi:hypothetical protein
MYIKLFSLLLSQFKIVKYNCFKIKISNKMTINKKMMKLIIMILLRNKFFNYNK